MTKFEQVYPKSLEGIQRGLLTDHLVEDKSKSKPELYSITLRNQCLIPPPPYDESGPYPKIWDNLKIRGPLLLRSRLEIYLPRVQHNENQAADTNSYIKSNRMENQKMEKENDTHILSHSFCPKESLNPVWRDLNDSIITKFQSNQEGRNLGTDKIPLSRLRARVIVDLPVSIENGALSELESTDPLDSSDEYLEFSPSSFGEESGKQNSTARDNNIQRVILADESLDPALWKCFGRTGDGHALSALPPNTMIIQYSDGGVHLRTPTLEWLSQSNVIFRQETASHKIGSGNNSNDHGPQSEVFSDKAFRALDSSVAHEKILENQIFTTTMVHSDLLSSNASTITPQKPKKKTIEDLYSLLGGGDSTEVPVEKSESKQHSPRGLNTTKVGSTGFENKHILNENEANVSSSSSINIDFHDYECNTNVCLSSDSQFTEKVQIKSANFTNKSSHELMTLHETLVFYDSLLDSEENVIQRLDFAYKKDVDSLKEIMQKTCFIEDNISRLEDNIIFRQEQELAESEFILSSRQCRLMKDLRLIYPITGASFASNTQGSTQPGSPLSQHTIHSSSTYSTSAAGASYRIRGLLIPSTDMLWNTHIVDNDTLSSALGHACHLVAMIAKYLDCPLRYRLICNASRSAVVEVASFSTGSVLGSTLAAQPPYLSDSGASGCTNEGDNDISSRHETITFETSMATRASQCANDAVNSTTLIGGALAIGSNYGTVSSLLYPLFRDKMEKDHFERGVSLLALNVDAILKKLAIPFVTNSHMLSKLDKVMEHVASGVT